MDFWTGTLFASRVGSGVHNKKSAQLEFISNDMWNLTKEGIFGIIPRSKTSKLLDLLLGIVTMADFLVRVPELKESTELSKLTILLIVATQLLYTTHPKVRADGEEDFLLWTSLTEAELLRFVRNGLKHQIISKHPDGDMPAREIDAQTEVTTSLQLASFSKSVR